MSVTFNSCLAGYLENFVRFKRLEGYDYHSSALSLRLFDQFMVDRSWSQPYLTRELLDQYESSLIVHSASYRYSQLSQIRVFSRYLQQKIPQSLVYETLPLKRPPRRSVYLYSDDDLINILKAAGELQPVSSIRPHSYVTLFGLLATTGLRIGEALALEVEDFSAQDQSLFIRKGKFGKDRWIPIALSTTQALERYLQVRQCHSAYPHTGKLFRNKRDKPLRKDSCGNTHRKLIKACHIGSQWPGRSPRLHDWRHTFAVNCLLKWDRAGLDANARLPILSTYMGHVGVTSTQVYLHTVPELMASASKRFSQFLYQNDRIGGLP